MHCMNARLLTITVKATMMKVLKHPWPRAGQHENKVTHTVLNVNRDSLKIPNKYLRISPIDNP